MHVRLLLWSRVGRMFKLLYGSEDVQVSVKFRTKVVYNFNMHVRVINSVKVYSDVQFVCIVVSTCVEFSPCTGCIISCIQYPHPLSRHRDGEQPGTYMYLST